MGLHMEQGRGTFWREGSCLDAELESVLRPRTGLLPLAGRAIPGES